MDDAEKIAAAWHDELQRLAPGYPDYVQHIGLDEL
jgi:hypothetical protein